MDFYANEAFLHHYNRVSMIILGASCNGKGAASREKTAFYQFLASNGLKQKII